MNIAIYPGRGECKRSRKAIHANPPHPVWTFRQLWPVRAPMGQAARNERRHSYGRFLHDSSSAFPHRALSVPGAGRCVTRNARHPPPPHARRVAAHQSRSRPSPRPHGPSAPHAPARPRLAPDHRPPLKTKSNCGSRSAERRGSCRRRPGSAAHTGRAPRSAAPVSDAKRPARLHEFGARYRTIRRSIAFRAAPAPPRVLQAP